MVGTVKNIYRILSEAGPSAVRQVMFDLSLERLKILQAMDSRLEAFNKRNQSVPFPSSFL